MQNYQFFCARLKYNIDKLIKINPKHTYTINVVRTGFGNPSPLKLMVPYTSTQAQTIELF